MASFRLKTMALQEIISEKLRAMVVRKKARHAYDVWFLLNKGVRLDRKLAQQKLDMYGMKLSKKLLDKAFDDIREVWDRELRALVAAHPDFKTVKNGILKSIQGRPRIEMD